MSGINEFVKTYLEERGYAINGRAAEIIGQADDWYRVRMTSEHKMVTVNGEGYTLDRGLWPNVPRRMTQTSAR